ncbi:MAG: RNA methyltransferase [Desulfobacteraceae bacterium]|nr:RNA methyltransferase [Desulfobacteraceae bacterium]
MKFKNVSIILVEPQGPINIGACCRVMKNFGFSDLRLVNPCRGYKSKDARKMALAAKDMLETAKLFKTLKSALEDCNIAFGTTRRSGKYRSDFITPKNTAKRIQEYDDNTKIALVFGREDNGLTTDELKTCQKFVTIPTDDAFASMNLSHAITILLYEINALNRINDNSIASRSKMDKGLANGKELEQMYSHMRETLIKIEYLDPQNPDHLLKSYRKIFSKAELTSRDVRIIRGLISKIGWINSQRGQPIKTSLKH